jgi:thiamine transport system permease protein
VILLLGGVKFSTLEVEIYLQALQFANLPLAALLSLIQLLCTLAFSALYSRVVTKINLPLNPRAAQANLRPARTLPEKALLAALLALIVGLFVLPLAALPARSVTRLEPARAERTEISPGLTDTYYRELFINRRDSLFYVPPVTALANSLMYAAATVILSLALGFPAAAALARPGKLEKFLDPFLMLPLGASAVTLGLGFIVSLPRDLLISPFLVPLAHTLIALPFVIRTLQPALASIPPRLREAAATLGADSAHIWREVDLPIVARATLASAIFAFTASLGEFGASLLLSRPEYPTLPSAIYRFLSQPGALNYGQAMAMATLLMLITGGALLFLEKLRLPGTGEF